MLASTSPSGSSATSASIAASAFSNTALAQRVVAYVQRSATSEPALFGAMLDHALAAAAAAPPDLVTPGARELHLRASRGIPRLVSHLLRISLILADERGHGPIDVSIVNTAAALLHLDSPAPRHASDQTRAERGPRSRG